MKKRGGCEGRGVKWLILEEMDVVWKRLRGFLVMVNHDVKFEIFYVRVVSPMSSCFSG